MLILGAQNLAWDEKSVRILSLLNAYGHPKEICQLRMTGASVRVVEKGIPLLDFCLRH